MAGTLDSQKYCEECGHMQFDRSHVVGNAPCTSVPGCNCKGEGEDGPCACDPKTGIFNHGPDGCEGAHHIPDQLPEDIRNMKSQAIFKATVWSRIPAHAKEGLPIQRKNVPGAAASYEERRASGIHISGRVQISRSYMRHRNVRPIDKVYGGGKVKEGARAWVNQPGATYLHSRETKDWAIGHEVGHHLLATRHTNFGHKDYAVLPPHEKRHLLRRMSPREVEAYKRAGHHVGEEALAEGYSHFFNNKEHELKAHAPQAHAMLSAHLNKIEKAKISQTDREAAMKKVGAKGAGLEVNAGERNEMLHHFRPTPEGHYGPGLHVFPVGEAETAGGSDDGRVHHEFKLADEHHHIVYRNAIGPVAAACVSVDKFHPDDGHLMAKPKASVNLFAANQHRGLLTGRAVAKVVGAIHERGWDSAHRTTMSPAAQGMAAHALRMKDRPKAFKSMHNGIWFDKGFKATDEDREHALGATGARPIDWDKDYRANYAREQLDKHPVGKPGLSVHRNSMPYGSRQHDQWRGEAHYSRAPGHHCIVYRDHKGVPVTAAKISSSKWGGKEVSSMVSDRSRGMLHGRGVFHVLKTLKHFKATHASDLTDDSQQMIAHAFHAESSNSRAARAITKGYKLTPERDARALSSTKAEAIPGSLNDPAERNEWDRYARGHLRDIPHGKPGLTVHHNTDFYHDGRDTHENASPGVHNIVYRDHKGVPVTMARVYEHKHKENGYDDRTDFCNRPEGHNVSTMVSDRSRGLLHGRGVFHVLRALHHMAGDNIHAGSMSEFSRRMTAHALESKDAGGRVTKGFKMDAQRKEDALSATGADSLSWSKEARDDYSHGVLTMHPQGRPGLTIHRHCEPTYGGYRRMPGLHQIVYRDHTGTPVTSAAVRTHDSVSGWDHSSHPDRPHDRDRDDCWSRKQGASLGGPHVESMASDRSRGMLHGRGVFHVLKVLHKMGATRSDAMTSDSQRLVAHAIDAQSRGTRAAKKISAA